MSKAPSQKAKRSQFIPPLSQDFTLHAVATPTKREIALELLKKGEMYLLNGDLTGIQFFEMSLEQVNDDATIHYQMGLALFEYGVSHRAPKELRLAVKHFRKANKLTPDVFEILHAWGNTFYCLGTETNSPSYFANAKNKYKKALALSSAQPKDYLSDLHWDYANAWVHIAEQSGEAIDLHIAMQSFEAAAELQNDMPAEFWQNFGECSSLLGKRTNDVSHLLRAIDCYKNAISLTISSHEGWYELAKAMADLYSYTQDEDHFSQANECFETAIKFKANSAEIWKKWGELLKDSGISRKDPAKLHAAIEKCQRASLCAPHDEEINYLWAESLSYLGVFTDTLKHIHEAENILSSIQEETPSYYYASGIVMHNQAEYFSDLDMYYQAVEKFQSGLSIDRSLPKHWFALGTSYLRCFEVEEDPKLIELASKFFHKSLNLLVSSQTHYWYATTQYRLGEINRHQEGIEHALYHFEQALSLQKNAIYLHPEWLFTYASALDCLGDFTDKDTYYAKSLEILNHVLMVDPEFPKIHYQIALVYSHFADLATDQEMFYRSLHHYQLAHAKEPDVDQIILDWGLTLINYAIISPFPEEARELYQEAEYKIIKAAKLGNTHAYYFLGCLFSLLCDEDRAIHFLCKAFESGALPSVQEMQDDEWLDNIRHVEQFQQLIEYMNLSQ